ncbi:hypothetical protein [Mycolicibacterium duvalii]|uniref:Uncharacterized protein n=1 Tax=Mycolicibacterium duvalii TaxID=39688 RepID=A0A7I7K0T8_9MYCO|nr:hypothetical protein [Mycolicibacterium duvalii]MCV7370868.1 hypothetical protein [Mycolicibacterium duvalii]BBX17119.1 hypothetical protein MDUV_19790 [Mycolicibacterium duvalii]
MVNFDQIPMRADLIPKDPAPELIKSMTWQVSMLAVTLVLAAAVFWYAIKRWRTTGRSEMFWMSLGALAAASYEPLGDFMVDITYHESGALRSVSGFGGIIPLWTMFMYVVFWAPGILYLTQKLETGITFKRWMGLFAITVPITLAFEIPMLALGLYKYYGSQQPIQVLGYPLWMAFSNSAVIFIVSLLVHAAMKTALVRDKPAYLVLLVPSIIIGVGVVTILPIGMAMSSTTSLIIINLFAVASTILSIAFVIIGYRLVIPALDDEISEVPETEKKDVASTV